eukprot:TRINITY_DN7924_c0_g1_i3.p1 TRINITY_DN7924_c0_g1~~TRINITY_DN7924_c0_g1_i3.p1  ORF type:complete len:648 (+),score=116.70 TRINITY_DN7924_c0_g1_i3:96-2039(+)
MFPTCSDGNGATDPFQATLARAISLHSSQVASLKLEVSRLESLLYANSLRPNGVPGKPLNEKGQGPSADFHICKPPSGDGYSPRLGQTTTPVSLDDVLKGCPSENSKLTGSESRLMRQNSKAEEVVERASIFGMTLPGRSRSQRNSVNYGGGVDRFSNTPRVSFKVSRTGRILRAVEEIMEIIVAVTVLINGVVIGIQTDYMARHLTQAVPAAFSWCEAIFCAVFSSELLVRLLVYRIKFFTMDSRFWNIFDVALVTLQWVEVIGAAMTTHESDEAPPVANVTFLRLLRVLRLMRVLRLVRLLQYFGELNVVASAIANSLTSLLGTLVLMLLIVYIAGIGFTQLVFNHRLKMMQDGETQDDDMAFWWGTLWRSMLSLFESVLGGADWDQPLLPLLDISWFLATAFILYIVFALLAVMNVITGIFVQSALKHAESKKDSSFTEHVAFLFEALDLSDDKITLPEYVEVMDDPEVGKHLRDMGLEPAEAKALFHYIDEDNSSEVDAKELLNSFVRLGAGAKFMDIMTLKHIMQDQHRRSYEWMMGVETFIVKMDSVDRIIASVSVTVERILLHQSAQAMLPRALMDMHDGMEKPATVRDHTLVPPPQDLPLTTNMVRDHTLVPPPQDLPLSTSMVHLDDDILREDELIAI